jgi:hypothetical protein
MSKKDIEKDQQVIGEVTEAINEDEGQTAEDEAASKYELAPEVEKVAAGLINKYHGHLAQAKITYLFRSGIWSTQRRETWGQAKKISGENKLLTGEDFRLIINKEVWEQLGETDKQALVDLYLECCCRDEDSMGNPKYFTQGFDFVGSVANIKRFGIWNPELKRVKDNLAQGKLFDNDGKVVQMPKAVNE